MAKKEETALEKVPREDHQEERGGGFTVLIFGGFGPPSSTPRPAPATEDPEKGWVCHCGAYEKGDGSKLVVLPPRPNGEVLEIDMKCGGCGCEYGFDVPRTGIIDGEVVEKRKELPDVQDH